MDLFIWWAIVYTILFTGNNMAGIVRIKICKRCNKAWPMVGKQTVCRACRQQAHKEACKSWHKKEGKGVRTAYQKKVGLTFEFTGGQWYWRASNGLTNGPFDTLRAAKRDANKAF